MTRLLTPAGSDSPRDGRWQAGKGLRKKNDKSDVHLPQPQTKAVTRFILFYFIFY
jgi:hypothetical protein